MILAAHEAPYTLFVEDDDYPMNPREDCDPFGKMVCWHSRYSLGDKHDYDDPEDFLRDLARRFPGRVAAVLGYSEALSHRIFGGSDFFLMPSLYEPCGLTQLYALRYGALPLVHATGGLDDTVEQYNEGTADGTGFKFYDASPQAFFDVIGWAVSTWFDRPGHYRAMQQRAMHRRFDWETSAKAYLDVYRRVRA